MPNKDIHLLLIVTFKLTDVQGLAVEPDGFSNTVK
jgi:hypothetical protein